MPILKTIGFNRMKKILFTVVALLMLWTSCSDESVAPSGSSVSLSNAKVASPKSTSKFGDYNVVVTSSSDGTTFTYIVTKVGNAKNLSHLIVNLDNCGSESATFNDILWATLNDQPVVFKDSEGKGTGCDPQSLTSNFVKFDNLGSASTYVIVVKFDRGYELASSTGWLKAGTSCSAGPIQGPGCPVNAHCSLSQGYYFAKGSWQNGSDEVWANASGVMLGENNYTHAEGSDIWNLNTAHKRGVIKAFFQYSAIQLSGANDPALDEAMTTINTYYTGKAKITTSNLSAQAGVFPDDAAVSAAGGLIGQWIDSNHCQ
jgi:hypothetical protein